MPIELKMTISGQVGYVIDKKRLDVLMLASREVPAPNHDHHGQIDQHTPALLLPLGRVASGSAPDLVLDAGEGAEEYGLWYLRNVFVEVRVDGQPPADHVKFSTETAAGTTPKPREEDSLFWLADVSKAAMMPCSFRADCRPPHPNPHLVSGALRIAQGAVVAYWSSDDAKTDVWDFQLPSSRDSGPKPYRQALADGIVWTVRAASRIEILLQSLHGHAMRSLVLEARTKAETSKIDGAVSNKPATVDGKAPFEAKQNEIHHFLLYYDVVEPAPPLTSRRVPVAFRVSTRDSRCPGSAG